LGYFYFLETIDISHFICNKLKKTMLYGCINSIYVRRDDFHSNSPLISEEGNIIVGDPSRIHYIIGY